MKQFLSGTVVFNDEKFKKLLRCENKLLHLTQSGTKVCYRYHLTLNSKREN